MATPPTDPKRQVTVRLAEGGIEALDSLAAELDVSRSVLIRRALREWIAARRRPNSG